MVESAAVFFQAAYEAPAWQQPVVVQQTVHPGQFDVQSVYKITCVGILQCMKKNAIIPLPWTFVRYYTMAEPA